MLISCWSFMGAVFLFFAIATSIMSQSILPAVIILIPIAFIATFVIVTTIDMNKAYVKIDGDNITTKKSNSSKKMLIFQQVCDIIT